MKNHILLSFFALASWLSLAQEKQLKFPEDCLGIYKGKLEINSAKGYQEVDMEFHLLATSTQGNYTYKLVYIIEGKKQERNYTLLEKDKEKGLYVIDENNGILLNAKAFGATLYAMFEVNGNLLTTTERFYENAMDFEITFAQKGKPLQTSATGESDAEVLSYPITTIQRAHLLKE